jgi:hypothetical protein
MVYICRNINFLMNMKRRKFICTGATAVAASTVGLTVAGCSTPATAPLKAGEVIHTVIFDLKTAVGSEASQAFMEDGRRILSAIPGVRGFEAFRQCSPKNDYQYGFLMSFGSAADFAAYTADPAHTQFVSERWEREVARFQESDFERFF